MNMYLLLILTFICVEYILNTISDLLNMRRLGQPLPENFNDVVDNATYVKSQEYAKATTVYGLVLSLVQTVLIIFLIVSGFFNILDNTVRIYVQEPILQGLVFIGSLALAADLLMLPFSLYQVFVLEERFGFNRMSLGTFVLDKLKGLFLAVIIGGPLLTLIFWFFQTAGSLAWLHCWIAFVLVSVVLQYLAPLFIIPLFFRLTPLEDGELKDKINSFAHSVGYEVSKIFVIDGSRRSTKSNAFFTGFGKNKRIALFDTLLKHHTTDELVAILAHEIGHNKLGHVTKNLIASIIKSGILFYLLSLFISHPPLFAAFKMQHISVYAGLVFFFFLYSPLAFFIGVITNLFSRAYEYAADRFAVLHTGNGLAMIKALKKLAVNNLANLTPHPLHVFLHYSHPPLLERIQAIEAVQKEQEAE